MLQRWKASGRRQLFGLMGHGYGLEHIAVEMAVDEAANVWMHTSLTLQHADEGRAVVLLLPVVKAFKERVAHVVESDGVKPAAHGACAVFGQHHHGRQLFVVADEDEFADSIHIAGLCRQQSENLRFEQLRCFIDDGSLEVLAAEQFHVVGQRDDCSCDDGHIQHQLLHLRSPRQPFGPFLQQMAPVIRGTRLGLANAQVVQWHFFGKTVQHLADFVHSAVGISCQHQ